MVSSIAACIVALTTLLFGCNRTVEQKSHEVTGISAQVHTDSVTFDDITQAAGIVWSHTNGADGRVFFPEQHCSGCAIFDYDNDGWQDVLLVQGRHWPDKRPPQESTMVLYRNNHNLTFTDVTETAGLNIPMFGMAATVGDYDDDGWSDLFISTFGTNHLFRNDRGVFTDVTADVGVLGPERWTSSALWLDYDNDGYLDLFTLSYFHWTPQDDVVCTVHGSIKTICSPAVYEGDYCQLYHNNKNGTFSNVSKSAGVADATGKALGAVILDFDNDGWIDIFISDDSSPNRLLHNEHGHFKDIGLAAGIAFDESGSARSGMGIDWADVDRDGRPTVMIGNFSGEMDWVYKYSGNNVWVDRAPINGIGSTTLPYLTFGLMMFDYDCDGWPDMFSANGHIHPKEALLDNHTPDRQSPLLFRNRHDGTFEEVGLQYIAGPFQKRTYGRGACYGDLDNDGNPDILMVNMNERPTLMHCRRTNSNHYLRIALQGTLSNRNGIGSRITARVGSMTMTEMMKSGASFQSSNELVVTLGLGQARTVDELIVRWSCGTVDTLRNISGDREIVVVEGMSQQAL